MLCWLVDYMVAVLHAGLLKTVIEKVEVTCFVFPIYASTSMLEVPTSVILEVKTRKVRV